MQQQYEYRVVPSPRRIARIKGLKAVEDQFAHTFAQAINDQAREGWEYVRAETLSAEEPRGLFRKPARVTETILIFRRPVEAVLHPATAIRAERAARPAPDPVPVAHAAEASRPAPQAAHAAEPRAAAAAPEPPLARPEPVLAAPPRGDRPAADRPAPDRSEGAGSSGILTRRQLRQGGTAALRPRRSEEPPLGG